MSNIAADNKTELQIAEGLKAHDAWCEFPPYSRTVWRFEVSNEETQLGYWDWVVQQIEINTNETH